MKNLSGLALNNYNIGVSPRLLYGDFDHHTTMGEMAKRIADDLRYEEKLKKIAKQKEDMVKGKDKAASDRFRQM